MSKLLWSPTKEIIENANITRFITYANETFHLELSTYNDLYLWSIDKIEDFWNAVSKFSSIIFSRKPSKIVENPNDFPPITKWFLDSKLNFAENLLRYRDDKIAIQSIREDGVSKSLSYEELYQEVAKLSWALRSAGVKTGDRVVAYMPNIPETIIAMLATTSIGATWASCGAELGAIAAIDRLGQIEPKILFSIDAYLYRGKKFDHITKVESVVSAINSIEQVIIVPYVETKPDISSIPNSVLIEDFSSKKITSIDFEQLVFDHPLFIMFSSGTTGKPKCLVQGSGGVLINHLKELILHTDLKRSDSLFYISSPSWMMWNWSATGLAVGLTLVLYDGNPLFPDWKAIWGIIDRLQVTVFGCSASYIHYLKSINISPREEFELSKLRQISQTGSSLSKEGFEYVYAEIKKDLHFNSISGGTDINGCFAAGSPTLPVYSGQLQARALGMRVVAYDQDANGVFDEQGELVCELPTPSMPLYFWNDENNEKYHDAYFGYYEDKKIWRHGDYIEVLSDTGGVIFYGRSDSILKPSGVRIGTAEIYNVVEEITEVSDSLAIGQQWHNDQRIILFVMMAEEKTFDKDLETKIKTQLRSKASPRHVPALIIVTPDIPYTFSGKKVESAITNIIHGTTISNRGALRNPECLEFFEKLGDLIN